MGNFSAGSFGGGMSTYGERGRFSGRGPKGWQRSDERIREDVSERLADHPDVDASEIEVTVKGGEVTLTGTVDERHAKRIAEDVAESVSGVREVHNQIRVQHGQHQTIGQGQSEQRGSTGTTTRSK
jgi:osmotically-inducible protein OsmY